MKIATSARMRCILGATLIATATPYIALAEKNSENLLAIAGSAAQSITGADTQSITGADALSITGADAQSITGADALSITGADAQSITGADALSITGADAQSITGADALSITGADAQSITGADGQSITGADAQSITGADGQSITGADALSITGADAWSITGADALSITGADTQVLTGPVDSIDMVNGVFESLGQVVMASHAMLSEMSVGDYVSVSGSVVSPGWLYADGVSISTEPYVPGASEVSVTGMISSNDLSTGTARVGSLTIDYTSSLGSTTAPIGPVWSFTGIQPSDRGVMLSDRTGFIR